MPEKQQELLDQNTSLSDQLLKGIDLMVKVTGQLAEYEQKLRDLVNGLDAHEIYGDHIDIPLAAARTLLEPKPVSPDA